MTPTENGRGYAGWSKAAALTAGLLTAGVVLCLLFFAQPLADDFCAAARGQAGVFRDVQRHYHLQGGRWASVGLEDWVMSRVDLIRWYASLLTAFWTIQIVSLALVIRALLDPGMTARRALMLALCFSLLFWANMPSPGDTAFWLTGNIEYQFSLSLTLMFFSILARGPLSPVRLGLAGLLAIIIPGEHELAGFLLCVVMIAGTFIALRLRHHAGGTLAVLTLVAILGFVFAVHAPGNWVRASQLIESQKPVSAVWLAVKQAGRALANWVFDLRLLSATVLFLIDPRLRSLRPKWFLWPVNWRLIVPGTWVTVLAAGFFAPGWAMGVAMPGRALTWLYMLFLAGWFLNVFVLTRRPLAGALVDGGLSPQIRSITLAVFAGGLVFQGNTSTAMDDLARRVVPWHKATIERYQLLGDAVHAGIHDARVPALPERPRMYFAYNLTSSPREHPNQCVAAYFGIASVVTRAGTEP